MLSVILYHAGLGCSGGFVGVDIFFVISGFLITSLLLKEMGEGRISLVAFWERRIRRIVPALFVVVCATLIGGWFFYLPEDFKIVGKSVLAQVFLASNIFFWKQFSYFDPDVDTKPLLHTWSLAVEEQFYVLFPLLLVCLARNKNLSIAQTIFWLGLCSFALCVWGSYPHPRATFYLLPTRAWELMMGAYLAAIPRRRLPQRWLNETLGLLGLGLILYSIFRYTRETRFPGWAAVPPCLGTALIIFFSQEKTTFAHRLLALRPLVFIGLISYSLYLWHWPALIFSKYLSINSQSLGLRLTLLTASAALAVLSWKYVETPVRKKLVLRSRPQVFAFAGASTAILLAFGWFVCRHDGLPSRIPENARRYAASRDHRAFLNEITLEQALAGQFVELGLQKTDQPITVLIWGDSHAMSLTPVIDELCRRHARRGIQATRSATAPVLDVSSKSVGLKKDSDAFNKAVLDFIAQRKVKNVILAAYWDWYPPSDSIKTGLVSTVRAIMALGANVYLVKDVPDQGFNVPRFAALTTMRNGSLAELGLSKQQIQMSNREFNQAFEQSTRTGAIVLDPSAYFLNDNGIYGVVKNGQILYSDGNHLTIEGARILSPLFEPIFSRSVE